MKQTHLAIKIYLENTWEIINSGSRCAIIFCNSILYANMEYLKRERERREREQSIDWLINCLTHFGIGKKKKKNDGVFLKPIILVNVL